LANYGPAEAINSSNGEKLPDPETPDIDFIDSILNIIKKYLDIVKITCIIKVNKYRIKWRNTFTEREFPLLSGILVNSIIFS